ncbi:MAG: hypothetical protein UY35_C0037G0001, partial [Candidatus Saccharibacteria bacterium GW2011_GWC2_48_9]
TTVCGGWVLRAGILDDRWSTAVASLEPGIGLVDTDRTGQASRPTCGIACDAAVPHAGLVARRDQLVIREDTRAEHLLSGLRRCGRVGRRDRARRQLVDPRHLDVGSLLRQVHAIDELDDGVILAAVATGCAVGVFEPSKMGDRVVAPLVTTLFPVQVVPIVDRVIVLGDVDLVERMVGRTDTVTRSHADLATVLVVADRGHGAEELRSLVVERDLSRIVHRSATWWLLRRSSRSESCEHGNRRHWGEYGYQSFP